MYGFSAGFSLNVLYYTHNRLTRSKYTNNNRRGVHVYTLCNYFAFLRARISRASIFVLCLCNIRYTRNVFHFKRNASSVCRRSICADDAMRIFSKTNNKYKTVFFVFYTRKKKIKGTKSKTRCVDFVRRDQFSPCVTDRERKIYNLYPFVEFTND